MPCGLQGDTNGTVPIPLWSSGAGDFSVSGSFIYVDATLAMIGRNTGASHVLVCVAGGTITLLIAGANISVTGFTAGDEVDFTVSRTAGQLTLDCNGTTNTVANTSVWSLDTFLAYNFNTLKFSGLLYNVWTLVSGTEATRTYNMSEPEGATVLVDTTSAQDGTLTGFTSGGFTCVGGFQQIIGSGLESSIIGDGVIS